MQLQRIIAHRHYYGKVVGVHNRIVGMDLMTMHVNNSSMGTGTAAFQVDFGQTATGLDKQWIICQELRTQLRGLMSTYQLIDFTDKFAREYNLKVIRSLSLTVLVNVPDKN